MDKWAYEATHEPNDALDSTFPSSKGLTCVSVSSQGMKLRPIKLLHMFNTISFAALPRRMDGVRT
jgi:hypothetical protein